MIGGPSIHSSGNYHEHNTGLCYEDSDNTDPDLFGIGCLYKNSHKNPAAAAAIGKRYWIIRHFAIGPAAGFTISESAPEGSNFSLLIGGLITVGTPQYSAQLFITPDIGEAPAVAWLQARFGF